ncbi:MAG: hypothetical protein KKA79_03295 [Nanoarchaeota archaeon]|nr:hypothetical protein [Nanoarchaeota archaeon]MCG2718766.1 hypothetical protein [Nanoarchaeota archaeon]
MKIWNEIWEETRIFFKDMAKSVKEFYKPGLEKVKNFFRTQPQINKFCKESFKLWKKLDDKYGSRATLAAIVLFAILFSMDHWLFLILALVQVLLVISIVIGELLEKEKAPAEKETVAKELPVEEDKIVAKPPVKKTQIKKKD